MLASACVDYLCKPDNCGELSALRDFRDNYMKSTEEGRSLLKEYYKLAPKIVKQIDKIGERELYYKYIWEVVVSCAFLISINENQRALAHYTEMVIRLKEQFKIGRKSGKKFKITRKNG